MECRHFCSVQLLEYKNSLSNLTLTMKKPVSVGICSLQIYLQRPKGEKVAVPENKQWNHMQTIISTPHLHSALCCLCMVLCHHSVPWPSPQGYNNTNTSNPSDHKLFIFSPSSVSSLYPRSHNDSNILQGYKTRCVMAFFLLFPLQIQTGDIFHCFLLLQPGPWFRLSASLTWKSPIAS